VHDITLGEKELGEISAVLPGRAGDQCNAIRHQLIRAGFFEKSQPQPPSKSAGLRAKRRNSSSLVV
jgi:hypothetical protein